MTSVVAGEFALALLNGKAGAIGVKIFNSIFPGTGDADYFDEVYKEIAKIIKKEIQQNTINEINGQINGIVQWCKNVYTPRKDSGAGKRELFDMIQSEEYDTVAVLQEPDIAEPGLGVFVIAAGIHLTLLQELALVDPDVSDPNKSSYAESVKLYTEQFAAFADKTFDSIEKNRTDVAIITEVKFLQESQPSAPDSTIEYPAEWIDKYIPKTFQDVTVFVHQKYWTYGTNVEMQERCKKARSDHIDQVKKDLVISLNDPKGVAKLWRELEEQPIPTQAQCFNDLQFQI